MAKSTFSRNIIFVSLIAVLILPVYTFLYLHPSFNALLTENIEKDAVRDTRHLAEMLLSGRSGPAGIALPPEFSAHVNTARRNFDIVKLKVFSPSGEVVFSTDDRDIGTINREPYFHEIVARGNAYTKVVRKAERTLERQTMPTDVVETYVPLMEESRFRGAFEVYYDIAPRKESIDAIVARSSAIVLTVVFLLLGTVVVSAVKAQRNMAARDRMERELARKEKLESLGVLSTCTAHDVHCLMASVSDNIAQAKAHAGDPERVRKSLAAAEQSAVSARELADELLAFSRGIRRERKAVSPGDLIRKAAADAVGKSPVRCEIPGDLRPVAVDERQITQSLLNLIEYCVKTMPQAGTLSIQGENVSLGKGTPLPISEGDYVRITLSREGMNVSEEDLGTLFDPYVHRNGSKSGLGLSTAFSVVQQHGGHVTAESLKGEGLMLRVYLPAAEREEQAA